MAFGEQVEGETSSSSASGHRHQRSEEEVGYAIGSGMVDWFCVDCGAYIDSTPLDDASPELADMLASIRGRFGV